MLTIIEAENPEHIALARELMLEYAAWLDFKLCFQGFEEELRSLPGKYAPPSGRLLLAYWNGKLAGMGAVRPIEDRVHRTCEMKRLYVRSEFRGHAIGRKLAYRLIEESRALGYEVMRLDTVPGKMDAAIAMYRDLGFEEIAPYYQTPVTATIFMQLALTNHSAESAR